MDRDSFPRQMTPEEDHYRRILRWEQGQTRRFGRPRLSRYYVNRRYYYGEQEEPDNVQQPLGVRYAPIINQKHVHYLFGEYEEDLVSWVVTPWDDSDPDSKGWEKARKIERAITHLMRLCDANTQIYKGALDGSIYGDTVFKVGYNDLWQRPVLDCYLPEYFHAIWDPTNQDRTLEAAIAFNMERAQAFSMFNSPGSSGFLPMNSGLSDAFASVWEYWNPYEVVMAVDDIVVYRGPNMYSRITESNVQPGMLPFIHIPNQSVNGEYWGFGDSEPALRLSDELNTRMADMGDIINSYAHPITVLTNWHGDVENLPVTADAVWSLGRDAEAKYLEWKGPPPTMLEFIDMLLKVMLETTSLTPMAFGRVEQSQASSAMANIQMLPVTEIVRRKRIDWNPRLKDSAMKLLYIESMYLERRGQGKFTEKYGFSIEELADYTIKPGWAPILPRDRLAVVNEQVGLMQNRARSILKALQDLGTDDPELERKRIVDDYAEFLKIEAKVNIMIADHEADKNMELQEQQAKLQKDQTTTDMQASQQDHNQKMEQDPTTDPERHARHLEQVKTQGNEQRKTMDKQAEVHERKAAAAVKIARVKSQSGGKNSDKASGGSNTDGGG